MSTGPSQMQQIFYILFSNGIHQKTYKFKQKPYPVMIRPIQ